MYCVNYMFYCKGVTKENLTFPVLRAAQREIDEQIGLGEEKYGVKKVGFTGEDKFVVEGRFYYKSKSAKDCLFASLKKEIKRVYPTCTVVHTEDTLIKKSEV